MENIGIILINYNTSDFTLSCVESIIDQSHSDLTFKIVIVDNNSSKDEFEKLNSLRKQQNIIIHRNSVNAGFGTGNMTGINFCSPEYYFFLNNDTVLLNDNLKILYDFMAGNPDAGICSGQLFHDNGERGINFNYIPDLKLKLLGSSLLRFIDKKNYPNKNRRYTSPIRVPVLNGSSLFVRVSALEKTGGFDPAFFLYCEEEDLAIRMKKSGYSLYLVPEAHFIHYEGKSSSSGKPMNYDYLKEFYLSQHHLYLKHFGKPAAWIWRITQFFRSLRKFYIHRDYARLAFVILLNPSLKQSLRYRQENK